MGTSNVEQSRYLYIRGDLHETIDDENRFVGMSNDEQSRYLYVRGDLHETSDDVRFLF